MAVATIIVGKVLYFLLAMVCHTSYKNKADVIISPNISGFLISEQSCDLTQHLFLKTILLDYR